MQTGTSRFNHSTALEFRPTSVGVCGAFRLTRAAWLVATLCCSPALFAQPAQARLGQPELHSSLGSPLWVKIPIEAAGADEDVTFARFTLGAPPQNAGIPFLEDAEISFERRGQKYFLVIRSRLAVNEPAIGLVVREQVSGGNRSREFTLLLDPPSLVSARIDERAPDTGRIDANAPPIPPPSLAQVQTAALPAAAQEATAPVS
ncbi:MAG: hypothetical protein ABI790_18985, partial [Betaproteobacteria bacterium]